MYLDPKNDLVFKRIFGEHPDLLISFLNALMPLDPGQEIISIEYLASEMAPDNPLKKNSIVDVRCIDNRGRQFIVEMQMHWTKAFNSRMLFNASKAYVRQLDRNEKFEMLQPVYCLGILNESFDSETESFYHHYRIVNRENTGEVIEGLEFVLVELPKFKPERWAERRMAVLWLRFLKEVRDSARRVSDDLLADERIRQAVDICEEGAFSDEELDAYDYYWDIIRTEKTLISGSIEKGEAIGLQKGLAKGREEGLEEGLKEGLAKGREEALEKIIQIVLNCAGKGMPADDIAALSGLSAGEVNAILKRQSK
jgi:predicted transposase/invertase (TIGR01784 family)